MPEHTNEKSIILYHGSRGGLEGDITTSFSRKYRDFGKGFYMGENRLQAASLVIDDAVPVLYTVKLHLEDISDEKILNLNGEKWVYTVLANRNRVHEFSKLHIAKKSIARLKRYDMVIGPIADDRMVEAMQKYEAGLLTDKGIQYCLTAVQYGNQYVAKTQFACSKVEILDEKSLYGREADEIRGYSLRMRDEGRDVIQNAMRLYRREGVFLDELIAKEARKERTEWDR